MVKIITQFFILLFFMSEDEHPKVLYNLLLAQQETQ